jgi:hypothetical protein
MVEQITSVLRPQFYDAVAAVLRGAKRRAFNAVNTTMVETYWKVGRMIFEEEQSGHARAEYAAYLIRDLAKRLTREFGRGYSEANLRNFRQFFLTFPADESKGIRYTLCSELTWSHYRALMRVSNPAARAWYVHEAAEQGWVVRTLLRQINSFAYERTLKSAGPSARKPKTPERKAAALEPREFIKDPAERSWPRRACHRKCLIETAAALRCRALKVQDIRQPDRLAPT